MCRIKQPQHKPILATLTDKTQKKMTTYSSGYTDGTVTQAINTAFAKEEVEGKVVVVALHKY